MLLGPVACFIDSGCTVPANCSPIQEFRCCWAPWLEKHLENKCVCVAISQRRNVDRHDDWCVGANAATPAQRCTPATDRCARGTENRQTAAASPTASKKRVTPGTWRTLSLMEGDNGHGQCAQRTQANRTQKRVGIILSARPVAHQRQHEFVSFFLSLLPWMPTNFSRWYTWVPKIGFSSQQIPGRMYVLDHANHDRHIISFHFPLETLPSARATSVECVRHTSFKSRSLVCAVNKMLWSGAGISLICKLNANSLRP